MSKQKQFISPRNFFREAEKKMLRLKKGHAVRPNPLGIEKAWMPPHIRKRICLYFQRRFFAGVPEKRILIAFFNGYYSAKAENKNLLIKKYINKFSEIKRVPLQKTTEELMALVEVIQKRRDLCDEYNIKAATKATKSRFEPSLVDAYGHWSLGFFGKTEEILRELKKELARIKFNEEFSHRQSFS